MYTSHKIHTHNKCLCILEMIKEVNNRIERNRADLKLYDNSRWDSPIQIMNRRQDFFDRMQRYAKIKNRLVSYYENTIAQLTNTASNKAA